MRVSIAVAVCACILLGIDARATADIFRWDNGRLISGTEGITPQPGARLDFRQLEFADLAERYMHGSSFRQANLSRADFTESVLAGSDLTLANLNRAKLMRADLGFSLFDLADMSGANLSGASILGSSLMRTKLTNANLSGAVLSGANLTNADLSGAVVSGASFRDNLGFTRAQLYSTASFQERNLAGIQLDNLVDLSLAEQNLAGARFVGDLERVDFSGAVLMGASFSPDAQWRDVNVTAADLRGAVDVRVTGRNTILSHGQIEGLELFDNDQLVVRDYEGEHGSDSENGSDALPVLVQQAMNVEPGGRLRLEFDKDAWDSTISFAPGIPITLNGTLQLDFLPGINTTTLRGRRIQIFDWSGVEPRGRW
jgi:uncharacterized protein YjbI with pentapeptide repeats